MFWYAAAHSISSSGLTVAALHFEGVMATQEIFQTNGILDTLTIPDRALLKAQLEEVDLPFHMALQLPYRKIPHVYFLQSGVASVVAIAKHERRQTETGLTGFEGMTGIAVVLGADRSPCHVMMQIAGCGLRISANDLRSAMFQSASLRDVFTRFAYVFAIQTEQTALSNAKGNLPERLARWLLMVHDRTHGDHFALTHELISTMVGVRRSGITHALGDFADANLIRIRRGKITVLSRVGLETAADGLYGVPEDEYKRLFH